MTNNIAANGLSEKRIKELVSLVWPQAVECGVPDYVGLTKFARAIEAECQKVQELEPVYGNVLPPVGSKVRIHLARQNAWVEHTVVGYYVCGDLKGNPALRRVFVRFRDADGHLISRLLAAPKTEKLATGCHRSHPHEDMNDECQRKTEEARAANSAARKPEKTEPVAQEPVHPDTESLVQRFAEAMRNKLATAERKYGYSNLWMHDDWLDECRAKLVEHLHKGDPLDVANYCAFLWHHGEHCKPVAQEPMAAWELDAETSKFLADMILADDEPTPITLSIGYVKDDDGKIQYGLRVHDTEYPEEGASLLVESPLYTAPQDQSAEVERLNKLLDDVLDEADRQHKEQHERNEKRIATLEAALRKAREGLNVYAPMSEAMSKPAREAIAAIDEVLKGETKC